MTLPKRVGLFYASNSGNTLLVARWIAEGLELAGYRVDVRDVAHTTPAALHNYDLLVFGSCTWERITEHGRLEAQLPEHFHRFAEVLHHDQMPDKKYAIFALGRREYTGFCGAAAHLQVFVRKLGGRPTTEVLKIDGFPHHQREVVDAWTTELVTALRPLVATLQK